jgi:hypothetical protein
MLTAIFIKALRKLRAKNWMKVYELLREVGIRHRKIPLSAPVSGTRREVDVSMCADRL